MLANLEISLDERPPGNRRGINQMMVEHHPGRTLESIKCARKSERYHELIQKLRNRRSAVPTAADTPTMEPAAEASNEVVDPTWAEDLLEVLRDTQCDPKTSPLSMSRKLSIRSRTIHYPGSKTPGCPPPVAFVLDLTLLGRMDHHLCGWRMERGDL